MADSIERAGGFVFHFSDSREASELLPHLSAIVENPESLPGFAIKRKGKIRKSLTYRFQTGAHGIYCKFVPAKNAFAVLKDLFRPSRGHNVQLQTRRMDELGFRGPRVIAYGERRRGPFVVESALLCEEIDNAQPLFEHLKSMLTRPDARKDWWAFVRQLGDYVGRMHRHGIAHGDLRLNNLLVQDRVAGADFVLLDNDRTRVYSRIPERLRLKNLQQINLIFLCGLNLTDRLRFFDAYHAAFVGVPASRVEHLRQVVIACERRLRRYIRETPEELAGIDPRQEFPQLVRQISEKKRDARGGGTR